MLCRAKKGRTYSVVSPTSIISGDTTFPTCRQLANELGILSDLKLSPYPTITTTTGATIRFRTADDPEKLRGPNLSGIWLDEASLMPLEAYNISIASLREGGEQGWLSATFTPKGIYHWTFDVFAKARVDTQIFRAATAENPFNPPGFSETLAGQYSPTFARQELGGEFLEIDGAEWPGTWFGESIWFDRWPHDLSILVIALDPSTGKDAHHGDYSALVALGRSGDGKLWCEADLSRRPMNQIVSDGIIFARRIESETRGHLAAFGVESNAFQQLLAAEFKTRTAAAGFMLPIVEVQNNVNKLVRIRRLTPHLSQGNIMFRRTPGTELLVRQLREFPIGEHDDGCLVAGTMIETDIGPRAIETILPGDCVLTRNGYRRVLESGCTGTKATIEVITKLGSLIGTPNHPVFDGHSFTRMLSICTMWKCQENTLQPSLNASYSTESISGVIRTRSSGLTECTTPLTPAIASWGLALSTKKSGSLFMDQSLKGSRSIIGTATRSITILGISNASQKRSMTPSTAKPEAAEQDVLEFQIQPALRQQLGIEARPESHGTNSTGRQAGRTERSRLSYVQNVQKPTKLSFLTEPNFVHPAAANDPTPLMVGMLGAPVIEIIPGKIEPVYNLSVDGGEYFANGFLVHNCDALEMARRIAIESWNRSQQSRPAERLRVR